jgi:hypothetical protein
MLCHSEQYKYDPEFPSISPTTPTMDDFTVYKSDKELLHFLNDLKTYKDPTYSLPHLHSGVIPPSIGHAELRSDSLVLMENGEVDGVKYSDWILLDSDFHVGAMGDMIPSGPWFGGSAFIRFYHGHVFALKNLPDSPNRVTPLHHYGVVHVPRGISPQQFFNYLDHNPAYAKSIIKPALPLPLPLHQNSPMVLPQPVTNFDTFATKLADSINLSFASHYQKEEAEKYMTVQRDLFGENLSDSTDDEVDQLNPEEYYVPVTLEDARREQEEEEKEKDGEGEEEEGEEEKKETKHYPSEVSLFGSDSDTDSDSNDSIYY